MPAGVVIALSMVLSACGGSGGAVDEVADRRADPNRGAIPTLPGGVELELLDPTTVLVGKDLAFGAPLPSEEAAAEALAEGTEVASSLARRVFTLEDGRHVADAAVLAIDGSQLFDEDALSAFVDALVASMGGGVARPEMIAGRTVVRAAAAGGSRSAAGFLEGNLLMVITGRSEQDVTLTITRQLEARARGEIGSAVPTTPLPAVVAPGAMFVAIPTVHFEGFAPPDQETAPEPPSMAGSAGTLGSYGVVAGERRTVVWVLTLDRGVHRWAESLVPAMNQLARDRAGGTAPTAGEVGGRVIYAAVNEPGNRSAQVFRHGGVVLVVEGNDAQQVDAVATAWIAALGTA